MFCLCSFLRNLFPPLTVFDLHKVSWIHASLRRIRDGPCIYAATRSTQHFSPFVQPNLATLEGCLLQRERNALEYRNVVLEKHSFKRVGPVNRHPCHHHRLTPGIYSPQSRSSHPQNHPASLLGCRQKSAKQSSPTDSRPSLDTGSTEQPGRSAVYTANMATPAANIATVVIATTVHPKRELGWPCISFLSEAITRIAARRKGASNPLRTAVQ